MVNDLIEMAEVGCEKGIADCHSTACLDERLQHEQIENQYQNSDNECEIVVLKKDNIAYEIHGIYHTTTDTNMWRHSHRRKEISMQADLACKHPDAVVFFEQGLLSSQHAIMLDDIKYALANLKKFKKEQLCTSKNRQSYDFVGKMEDYINATHEIVRATLCNSEGLFHNKVAAELMYFSKAILLPQPIGMESNLLYLKSYLENHEANSSEVRGLYAGLTPERPAYMAQKLKDAANNSQATKILLYCGIGHTEEIVFLLKNPEYISRYLRPNYGTLS